MTAPAQPCDRVVVFDLDDTLYPEWTYARSGLAAVGDWAKRELGLAGFFERAWHEFEHGERTRVFDHTLAALGREADPAAIAAMIEVYRQHRPDIALAADAKAWLDTITPGTGLALISDGFVAAQTRKVEALGLAARGFEPIVLTDSWGREFWKPHARAFGRVEQHFGLPPERIAYVADNPTKDFVTPRRRGWATIQILRPDRIHRVDPPSPDHAPDFRIESLGELNRALSLDHSAARVR
jgi:putative hydrolase of the HAD superfamily